MKVGKLEKGNLSVKVINEEDLASHINDGWMMISESDKPSESAVARYIPISNGWIEAWEEPSVD